MTAGVQAWSPTGDRRIYPVWLAILWVGTVAGFGLDIPGFLKQQPPAGLIVHIHALAMVGWMALVTTQMMLVETGRVALHRKLGAWTAAYLALIVPLALAAGLSSQFAKLPHGHPQFIILNFVDVGSLAALVLAGVVFRRDAAAHKRLMALSLVAIADPGFSRASGALLDFPVTGPWTFFWSFFWANVGLLVAMAGWDLWTRRRLHPAFVGGAVFLLAGEALCSILYFNAGWRAVASGIVRAWGWNGG
ncbi:MAG TPA: hypothetical protein VG248_10505 [Caulobacteraceae bacterium]|jgi:hypothetical protein|nr:hypothetical protein [Caulobacteraceae bacterium]